ncbi:Hypothetical predicted protein [Olea europaea subsp. europaea]|uniref:Uncharacterized protein n=1 Tax=Olea europaea subsp. europaea TaxID=158383 RepID=A0A8S0PRR9_OLEEU|nr:Hypothetical predicted protein [Olea europaea subsp. europaea]
MFGTLPGHVRDTNRFSTKRRKHGVHAMSGAQVRSQAFWAVFGTRCAGHIRDKSWPRQSLGHGVQAMSRTRLSYGHVRDTAATQTDFQALLGTVCGHVRNASWLRQGRNLISRQFVGTVCRQCSGRFSAMPCPGRILAAAGMQTDFQAFLGSFLGNVQATAGAQPDFHVFLGNFWEVVCRPCPGCVWAAAGTQPDFQVVSRTWCAGHVQDAVGTQPDFQAFLDSFWDTMYKQCSGRVQATAGTQPDFQAFFWKVFGHGVQAMS